MEQATQATTPTAPTDRDDRAAYERAQSVITEIVSQVPTLPHSVRTGRELSPRYDVHLYFGAGLNAGRGVLQTAAVISAEPTRDDQHDGEGNVTSVWIEVRATVRRVPVYAYGLTSPAEADELLQQTAPDETDEAPESATEVTQPLPTVGAAPTDVVIPALTAVTPLSARTTAVVADSEDSARCVKCGCTEDAACEGGCYWVPNSDMVDLCSACATPQQLAAMVFTPASASDGDR